METIKTNADWAIEATVTTLQAVVYGSKTDNCTRIPGYSKEFED
jgi:hypothetical protein